jgi:hypothetical protein
MLRNRSVWVASTLRTLIAMALIGCEGVVAIAQGPMPEEGATLFPHGALISFGSTLVSGSQLDGPAAGASEPGTHPEFSAGMPLTFSWSFRRDWQLTAEVPIVTRRTESAQLSHSATGVGDALVTLKHRFLRLDSERGTTQMSLTIGPKLQTGRAAHRIRGGALLSPQMQPGTGTTDLFVKANLTYTGLFNSRRLVADPSFGYLKRFGTANGGRPGDKAEVRLWVHYRPLQTRFVGGEWFIGPTVTWEHAARNLQGGIREPKTGFDVLSVGLTSYISPWGGLVFWGGIDFPVAQDWNGAAFERDRRIHFGFTKQFVLQP